MRISVGDFRIGDEERKAVNEVLDSGRITEGEKVREFEKEWAKFIGTKYSIAVNSGTSALIAGLMGFEAHSKVITTPLTYIATSNAIVLNNLEPVYVDVDKETFGITPENIKIHLEQADNTFDYLAILPVHLMGYPCDMYKINKIAKDYGLDVIEDSSQAHGSLYKGKKTGSLSFLSTFSFYVAHNISCGELGAVNTNDYDVIKYIRKIKANGRMCDCPICTRPKGICPRASEDYDPRFTHEYIGYNFKTTEFSAALALVNLRKADWIIKKRRENVKYLNEGLRGLSNILQLPKYSKNVSYLAYPIVIKKPEIKNKLLFELEKRGIENRPIFGCIPTQQPAYKYLKEKYKGKLPNAEYIGKNGFYIGCHQYLEQDDLDYMIKTIKSVIYGKIS